MFNIYDWIDSYHVEANFIGKLIDIDNWIDILTDLGCRNNQICTKGIYFEIPKIAVISKQMRRPIKDLLNLDQNDYVNTGIYTSKIRKEPSNRLAILIQDGEITPSPIADINPLLPEEIKNCDKPLILVLIKIIIMKQGRITTNHVNALIIDHNNQIYELFDPYGRTYQQVHNYFSYIFPSLTGLYNYKYLSPINICPSLGPQYKAEKIIRPSKDYRGHCYAYTLMYIQMRLCNSQLDQTEIIDILLGKEIDELQKYAIKYNMILHRYYGWPFR